MTKPKIFACSLCQEEFINLVKFQEHMAWHDSLVEKRKAKLVEPSATELLGITKPPTTNTQVDPYARPKLKDVVKASPPTMPQEHAKPTFRPIVLSYQYGGDCPQCGTPVETIEVHLPEKNAITAYCVPCKITHAQELVIPIKNQIKRKEV